MRKTFRLVSLSTPVSFRWKAPLTPCSKFCLGPPHFLRFPHSLRDQYSFPDAFPKSKFFCFTFHTPSTFHIHSIFYYLLPTCTSGGWDGCSTSTSGPPGTGPPLFLPLLLCRSPQQSRLMGRENFSHLLNSTHQQIWPIFVIQRLVFSDLIYRDSGARSSSGKGRCGDWLREKLDYSFHTPPTTPNSSSG
jgi:hypothetical protein